MCLSRDGEMKLRKEFKKSESGGIAKVGTRKGAGSQ